MKKIMTLALGVLISTTMFGNGSEAPGTSSFKVVSSGTDLFRLFYKTSRPNDVKISVYDERSRVVFTETVKKTDGFVRPYNFENLPLGRYIVEIQDAEGEHVQKITYGSPKIEKDITIARIEKGKYLLSGISRGSDTIVVRIYDADGKIAYEETRAVDGNFAQVYNLKNITGIFTMEVTDANGVLKTFRQ
jgi:hypothetical protein